MKQEVMTFIKKHQLLKENSTVLVGVSGGPDSMALLHYLSTLKRNWGIEVIAVCVDHQLRGDESLGDLEYVRETCQKWEIPFKGVSLDVPSYKREERVGTQAAARVLRYRFFAEQMKAHRADFLALGHHGDDQVETMVMNLVRAGSSRSFSGIPVKREFAGGSIVRPFLTVTKEDITAYCEKHSIYPRLDPSNEETNYTRNFYRKKVVPLLKQKNSNIHTTVQHLSDTLREDEEYLWEEAEKVLKETVQLWKTERKATLTIPVFSKHPPALQRRVFHLILNYLYDKLPKDLSYIHEEHFFGLLEKDKGNVRIDFPGKLKVEKSYGKVVLYFPEDSQSLPYHFTLPVPGRITLPDGSVLRSYFGEWDEEEGSCHYCCTGQIALPLHIRTRQPGDRMAVRGMKGSKKVKDIFIDEKIPKSARDQWPVVMDDAENILWLPRVRKGEVSHQSAETSAIHIKYEKRDV
ncbi:tRNA lysidine(34) synthetase TilS [Virgibacillus xinjiangensis]|uniref:tRNA(Ile)-lysidine synthase n=1 Tax=Virgibacillus xinjiangensis TaxID=393090 RepID=A0ABV7CYA4_9BACI